jgi:ParB/RepB/Spo0J family partition protein
MIKEVQIHKVVEGYHPRKGLKGNEELREQIQKNGMTEPIRVRPEGDHFVVIDGVRRLQVARDLGWTSVPCIIEEIDERTAAHRSYLHNSADCRRNLNPIEVALHIKEMRDRFGYSILDLVGLGYAKDDQTLYNKLSLLTLPQDIQDKIANAEVSPTIGYELVRNLARTQDKDCLLQSFKGLCEKNDLTVSRFKKSMRDLIDSEGPKKDNLNPEIKIPEGEIPGVYFRDSSDRSELPDQSVHLIVTSPPYGVGMEYEEGVSFEGHLKMLDGVFGECVRVLVPGRKMCINVGDITNFGSRKDGKPEIQLIGHFYQDILRKHGVRLVDMIIWKKCHPGKRDFNWFTNPQVTYHKKVRHSTYRILNNTEYVYIFEKDGDTKLPYGPEISKEEWKEWVDGVWEIPPVKGETDHPAPFPDELVRRLVKMYSFEGDIVLDPFGGTMTTVKVARELKRIGIGYEKDDKYKSAIMRKLGIKVDDLMKSDAKGQLPELTAEERTEEIGKLVTDLIPQIASETMEKGELIASISCALKRNLSKDDLIVETVPLDGDSPPIPPTPKVMKADEYEEVGGTSALQSIVAENSPDNTSLLNKVVLGDAFQVAKEIEPDSVDLCLTSPPYADVKDYGEEVGVVSPDEYVDWILPLLKEIHRTLKPTGSFILNINDCVVNKNRHPFVHELILRSTKETPLKLYDTYYWVKRGTLPNGSNKRLNNWTEYLFHFCKDPDAVKWNMDAVREPYDMNTVTRCKYPVNTLDAPVDEKGRPRARGRRVIQLNPKGKRPSNVFYFPTAAAVRDKKHPAAFHPDLPTWFIKALTDENDLVADVFAGSGTTCIAAKSLKRNFIGIELNEEYQKCALERLQEGALAEAA